MRCTLLCAVIRADIKRKYKLWFFFFRNFSCLMQIDFLPKWSCCTQLPHPFFDAAWDWPTFPGWYRAVHDYRYRPRKLSLAKKKSSPKTMNHCRSSSLVAKVNTRIFIVDPFTFDHLKYDVLTYSHSSVFTNTQNSMWVLGTGCLSNSRTFFLLF